MPFCELIISVHKIPCRQKMTLTASEVMTLNQHHFMAMLICSLLKLQGWSQMFFAARAPAFFVFLYSHSKSSLMLPVTSSLIASKGLKLTYDQRLHFDNSSAIKCESQVGCCSLILIPCSSVGIKPEPQHLLADQAVRCLNVSTCRHRRLCSSCWMLGPSPADTE